MVPTGFYNNYPKKHQMYLKRVLELLSPVKAPQNTAHPCISYYLSSSENRSPGLVLSQKSVATLKLPQGCLLR